jgi:uncharacterized repeat protein (TIGR01451 family)
MGSAGTGGMAGAAGSSGSAGTGGIAGALGAGGMAGRGGSGGTGGSTPGTGGGSAGTAGSMAGAGGGGSGTGGGGGSTSGSGGSGVGGSGAGGAGGGVEAPLVFDVSAVSSPVVPGGRLFYTMTVGNVSSHAVNGASLSLRVPNGLQFVYTTDAEPNATGCLTCSANTTATWNLGTLAAGASRTLTVNAQVLQTVGDGDSIAAPFTLSATGINAINLTKTVQVFGSPAGQVALGTANNAVAPNQRFTLDLDVGKLGTATLANAGLRVTVPVGLSVASISDGGTQTSQDVTWTLGSVAAGAVHRSIDVTVDTSVTAGSVLAPRAVLTYDGGADVDAIAELPVVVVAALSPLKIDVGVASSPVLPGGRALYTVTLGNTSTVALDGVVFWLRVPSGLQFVYTSDANPNATGCLTCSADTAAVWSVGTLAAGASQSITFNATVVSTAVGDGAVIRTPFYVAATGVDSMTVVKTVPVFSRPGAQLELGAVTNHAVPGKAFTFDIDIGQIGSNALDGAELRAFLPPGVTVGTIGDGGTQPAAGQVLWTIGAIPVAATLHRKIDVTVGAGTLPGAVLAPRVQLTYTGGPDVDALAEYAASVVVSDPPLQLQLVAAPNPGVPGSRLLYTATLNNPSGRAVNTVGLFFRVPVGIQFVYTTDAEPNASGCLTCAAHSESTWSFTTLASGGVQAITINANLLSTVPTGGLIPSVFRVDASALAAPLIVKLTVPAH